MLMQSWVVQLLPNPNNRGKIVSDKTGSEGWISELRRCRQGEDLRVNCRARWSIRGGSCWSQTERAPRPCQGGLGEMLGTAKATPGSVSCNARPGQFVLFILLQGMCTLHWQEAQCLLQQPPLGGESCPWDSPIDPPTARPLWVLHRAPKPIYFLLGLKTAHNIPVDSSTLCHTKPVFLLLNIFETCSIFLHYKHKKDWPNKSKGWGGKAGIVFRSEHWNISCSLRDIGALQALSRSGAIWVLFCSRALEYSNFKQRKKENPKNPSSSLPQTKNGFFLF